MKPSLNQSVPYSLFSKIKSTLLIFCIIASLQSAWAGNLYRTGFDKPFVADVPLNGQDGWATVPVLSPDAAVVTTDKPRIGKQTVEVSGANLVSQDFIEELTDGYYHAIGSYRRAVEFDTEGTQIVRVSAMVRVDGQQTATGNNFFSASISARAVLVNGDTAGVGELAISSDGHVYGHSGNEDIPTMLTSAPIKLGKWHRLSIVINFGTHKYSFYVGDTFLGDFAFATNNVDENGIPIPYTNVLRRGSFIAYAAPDTAELKKEDYSARFDRFTIKSEELED